MKINRSIVAALFPAPSFPGSGHTFVSCPHPAQPYRRNNLWPRNDSPNRASSSNAETAETFSSSFGPSIAPIAQILISSAEPLPPSARDQPAHSFQQLRIRQNHISLVCPIPGTPLSPPSECENDILAPTQHGTDSAISCVITYGICSLLPPCAFVVATTPRKDSSERPLRPFPFGTGIASPYYPTRRVGVSTFI